MDRTALQRGYAYQDLVTACFMTDAVVASHNLVYADQKFPLNDKLDDVTVDCGGTWFKCQVKHSESMQLKVSDFKNASGDLRLAALVETHLGFEGRANCTYHTILKRKKPNSSDELSTYLVSIDEPSVLSEISVQVFQLDGDLLWPEGGVPIWPDLASCRVTRETFLDFIKSSESNPAQIKAFLHTQFERDYYFRFIKPKGDDDRISENPDISIAGI